MNIPALSCLVETEGIAHVFRTFEVGERCACARAVVTLSDDERELVVRRSWWARPHRRAPAPDLPGARPVADLDERDRLLCGGNAAIAYARQLRARVIAERASLHEHRRRRIAARAARLARSGDRVLGWHVS